jgi:hypothetical protein
MITVELSGGLGNQMFQYAIGKSLSIRHNTNLKLDKHFLLDRRPRKNFVYRNYDLDIFNFSVEFADWDTIGKYSQLASPYHKFLRKLFPLDDRIVESSRHEYDSRIFKRKGNLYLSGYWQNYVYFEDIESIVRRDFSFRNELNIHGKELQLEIRNSNSVAINFRLTDFVHNPSHGSLGLEYYKAGLEILNKNYSNLKFFVFSDDIEWCQKNLSGLNIPLNFVPHNFAGNKFESYMQLMCSCNHFLIPNSSFAWWAAYLASNREKTVIVPKVWLHNVPIYTKSISPSNWISI